MASNKKLVKEIYLQRHGANKLDPRQEAGGWQPSSELGDGAVVALQVLRDQHFGSKVRFRKSFSSPYTRAMQTAVVSTGIHIKDITPLPQLAPYCAQEFDEALIKTLRAQWPLTLDAIEALCPGMVDRERIWAVAGIMSILQQIEVGQAAYACGHQPLIGMVRNYFAPQYPMDMQDISKGDVLFMEFDASNKFVRLQHLK